MIKKVKIPQLKEVNFLIVPMPLENELFSSWLVRTAYAHKTHPHTFENLYLDLPQRLFSKNIDVALDRETAKNIEEKCRNKIHIYSLTMQSYDAYLQEKIIPNGFNKFITPLRYCPQCLTEDKIPYFRKEWRITLSTICLKHHCYLQESCPKCMSRLDVSKTYKNKLPYTYCYKCGFELKKSKNLSIHFAYKGHIQNTKELFSILHNGYMGLGSHVVYSFYFFDAVAQLSKIMLTHKIFNIIDVYLPVSMLSKWKKQKYCSHSPIYTQISIKEQFVLFSSILMLFKDYPHVIKSFVLSNKLTYWKTLKDMSYSSFWFENLINSITPRYTSATRLITKQEIENAKRYLLSKNIPITKANLTRLLGCNFFSIYNNLEV